MDSGSQPDNPPDAGSPLTCHIIRVLPDGRLRMNVEGTELALRGLKDSPPSLRFAQLVARAATPPRKTRCWLAGSALTLEVEDLFVADAGWVDLSGAALDAGAR